MAAFNFCRFEARVPCLFRLNCLIVYTEYLNPMSSSDRVNYNAMGHQSIDSGTGIEMEETIITTRQTFFETITGGSMKGTVFEAVDNSSNYRFAVNASWAVNWFLLGKLGSYRMSLSFVIVTVSP